MRCHHELCCVEFIVVIAAVVIAVVVIVVIAAVVIVVIAAVLFLHLLFSSLKKYWENRRALYNGAPQTQVIHSRYDEVAYAISKLSPIAPI